MGEPQGRLEKGVGSIDRGDPQKKLLVELDTFSDSRRKPNPHLRRGQRKGAVPSTLLFERLLQASSRILEIGCHVWRWTYSSLFTWPRYIPWPCYFPWP